jgi:hypothetical protein
MKKNILYREKDIEVINEKLPEIIEETEKLKLSSLEPTINEYHTVMKDIMTLIDELPDEIRTIIISYLPYAKIKFMNTPNNHTIGLYKFFSTPRRQRSNNYPSVLFRPILLLRSTKYLPATCLSLYELG